MNFDPDTLPYESGLGYFENGLGWFVFCLFVCFFFFFFFFFLCVVLGVTTDLSPGTVLYLEIIRVGLSPGRHEVIKEPLIFQVVCIKAFK